MKAYPLLFSYRDPVIGNGYVAGVEMRGRALLTAEDEEEWWVEGVNPGGFASGGATRQEALFSFRTTYQNVLVDIAYDAQDFGEFRRQVEASFRESSDVVVADFDAAVQSVRQGEVDADWLSKQRFDDRAIGVEVALIERFGPEENSASETGLAA